MKEKFLDFCPAPQYSTEEHDFLKMLQDNVKIDTFKDLEFIKYTSGQPNYCLCGHCIKRSWWWKNKRSGIVFALGENCNNHLYYILKEMKEI